MSLTTDRNDPDLGHGTNNGPVPQNKKYLVLSEEELAKGFVRPVRTSYVHVGKFYDKGIEILDNPYISDDGKKHVAIVTVMLKEDGSRLGGAYLTQQELDQYNRTGGYVGGCGQITTMHRTIAETYAANPKFYGATYCTACYQHLPVSEFRWVDDNEVVGS